MAFSAPLPKGPSDKPPKIPLLAAGLGWPCTFAVAVLALEGDLATNEGFVAFSALLMLVGTFFLATHYFSLLPTASYYKKKREEQQKTLDEESS